MEIRLDIRPDVDHSPFRAKHTSFFAIVLHPTTSGEEADLDTIIESGIRPTFHKSPSNRYIEYSVCFHGPDK